MSRSPRGSIAPDAIRTSPRGSIAGAEYSTSPRGSIGPEMIDKSPRGSIARSSGEAETKRSPRGSLTLTFQEPPAQERRASADNATQGKVRCCFLLSFLTV